MVEFSPEEREAYIKGCIETSGPDLNGQYYTPLEAFPQHKEYIAARGEACDLEEELYWLKKKVKEAKKKKRHFERLWNKFCKAYHAGKPRLPKAPPSPLLYRLGGK